MTGAAECVLGVDFGTESVRVGLFDLRGHPVALASEPYAVRHPRPGWAEQDPAEWWAALSRAARVALERAAVSPERVVGVGADCTSCTVVALDGDGHPLRPAIIWMDVRAAAEAREIARTRHPALRYNGFGDVSAEWMPCKALWLKRHEPAVYHRAARICEFIDWLTYRLTGQWTASLNNASIRWYYDARAGGWPISFYEEIGLGDVIAKFPPRVLPLGAVAGELTTEAAAALGLRPGTPVAQGGADAFVAMLGLGAIRPGQLAFIVGSSHVHLGQSDTEFHAPGIFGTYPDAVIPGLWTVEGGQTSTGSVVRWFRDQFCDGLGAEASRRGMDVYTLLNEQAAPIPPGSEGLVVLDYWQGNRTPYVDPDARGLISGLTLHHTRAHVFRAILEGIAYGTEHILRTLATNGYRVSELVAAGGPVKSRLWMQIHADVSNLPIVLTRVPDAAALGSAILGATAGGVFGAPSEGAQAMVRVADRIEPRPDVHEAYRFYVDTYIATYRQVRALMHGVTRHVAAGGGRATG